MDWEAGAAATVALLRTEAGREPHDKALRELIGELSTTSEAFSAFWAAHDIRIRHEGTKRLQHPEVGEIELTYQSVDLPTGEARLARPVLLHRRARQPARGASEASGEFGGTDPGGAHDEGLMPRTLAQLSPPP